MPISILLFSSAFHFRHSKRQFINNVFLCRRAFNVKCSCINRRISISFSSNARPSFFFVKYSEQTRLSGVVIPVFSCDRHIFLCRTKIVKYQSTAFFFPFPLLKNGEVLVIPEYNSSTMFFFVDH